MKNSYPDNEQLHRAASMSLDAIKQQMEAQTQQLKPIVLQATTEVIADIDADVSSLAKAMIEEMDKNHDEKVSKREFEEYFSEALAHVMSLDAKIMKLMGMTPPSESPN